MSLCTVVIIACHPSDIILSQNVIIDQLKNFTFRFYHIRTIAHEHFNLIGQTTNTRYKAQCAMTQIDVTFYWSKIEPSYCQGFG